MGIDNLPNDVREIVQNPQHPLHAAYLRGEPAVVERVNQAYKNLYGTAKAGEYLDSELGEELAKIRQRWNAWK